MSEDLVLHDSSARSCSSALAPPGSSCASASISASAGIGVGADLGLVDFAPIKKKTAVVSTIAGSVDRLVVENALTRCERLEQGDKTTKNKNKSKSKKKSQQSFKKGNHGKRKWVDYRMEAQRIGHELSERKIGLILRVIKIAGLSIARQVLKETLEIENQKDGDGLRTESGSRRTPGGVFFTLLKNHVSKEMYKEIYTIERNLKSKRKQETKKRKMQVDQVGDEGGEYENEDPNMVSVMSEDDHNDDNYDDDNDDDDDDNMDIDETSCILDQPRNAKRACTWRTETVLKNASLLSTTTTNNNNVSITATQEVDYNPRFHNRSEEDSSDLEELSFFS